MGFSQIFNLIVLKAYANTSIGELKNPLCPIGDPNCASGGFIEIVNKLISALLSLAVPIVGLMILIGGFQIMTAQGNAEKVGEGKKTITYAIIGFAVILMAKSVVLIIKSFFETSTV